MLIGVDSLEASWIPQCCIFPLGSLGNQWLWSTASEKVDGRTHETSSAFDALEMITFSLRSGSRAIYIHCFIVGLRINEPWESFFNNCFHFLSVNIFIISNTGTSLRNRSPLVDVVVNAPRILWSRCCFRGLEEMAQWWTVLAVFAKDLGSGPRIQVVAQNHLELPFQSIRHPLLTDAVTAHTVPRNVSDKHIHK